jgi:hypothetical protein
MDISRFFGKRDPADVCRVVEKFCAKTRASLLERGAAPSKQVGGKVPDNPVAAERDAQGERKRITSKGEISVEKGLAPDFTLIVKHPGLFTALLAELAPRFPVHAVVRNPLSILSSWNSIPFHIRDGRVPATERLDPALKDALDAIPDATARQLHVLDWYFSRYARLLEPSRILRYEDLIASRGKSLAAVVPAASALDEDLKSRNKNELYDPATMSRLAERLLADHGAWRRFYAPADVEALLR